MEPVIAVASGKGGTGKTTFAINLLKSLDTKSYYFDADVEEPNGHIFLKPVIMAQKEVTVMVPKPDATLCKGCGACSSVCKFNALILLKDEVLVYPELCHGCGSCIIVCPNKALKESQRRVGHIRTSFANGIGFIEGRLNEGEAKAPPVIKELHDYINKNFLNVIDVAPGASCSAIEGIRKSDFVVLVTEPTPFGLHDLKLAVEMVRRVGKPFGVVINKSDLGDKNVEEYCKNEGIPVLMKIPFDKEIAYLYSQGELLVPKIPGLRKHFVNCYQKIREILKQQSQGVKQ